MPRESASGERGQLGRPFHRAGQRAVETGARRTTQPHRRPRSAVGGSSRRTAGRTAAATAQGTAQRTAAHSSAQATGRTRRDARRGAGNVPAVRHRERAARRIGVPRNGGVHSAGRALRIYSPGRLVWKSGRVAEGQGAELLWRLPWPLATAAVSHRGAVHRLRCTAVGDLLL